MRQGLGPLVCCFLLAVAGCRGGDGGGDGEGASEPTETSAKPTAFTPPQVKAQLDRELDLYVGFDPPEDEDVSVLKTGTDIRYGSFTIWVFKPGRAATDFSLDDIDVPPKGQLAWSEWEALDAELLPGEGSYTVLKTYGNVVLYYFVDAKE